MALIKAWPVFDGSTMFGADDVIRTRDSSTRCAGFVSISMRATAFTADTTAMVGKVGESPWSRGPHMRDGRGCDDRNMVS